MLREVHHDLAPQIPRGPEQQLPDLAAAGQIHRQVGQALAVRERQGLIRGLDADGQHVGDPRVGHQAPHETLAERRGRAGHQHRDQRNTPSR